MMGVIGPTMPEHPKNIGRYLVQRPLGQGAMGTVYLAEDPLLKRRLAIKVVRAVGEERDLALDRFKREAEISAQLNHPNIVTVYDVGEEEGYGPFLAMEFVEGQSLGKHIRENSLEVETRLGILVQAMRALRAAHRHAIVHRDVKPDNCIFLDGELKLADFGLVTEADGSISLAGTLKYMPKDLTMDAQADVYAAGLVIYEMYSGNPVDRFPSLVPNGEALLSDPRLVALNRVVLRAADPARESRYANAPQMLADLRAALSRQAESTSGAKITTSIKRLARTVWPVRRRSAAIILGCLLLLCLAVTSLWLAWFKPPPIVDVNFITEPFGARVVLDGSPLESGSGPYVTPCTIPSLTAEIHRVVFRHPDLGDVDAGAVDFARVREVTARWPTLPAKTAASPNP